MVKIICLCGTWMKISEKQGGIASNMSLSSKLISMIGLLILIIFAIVSMTLWVLSKQKSDAVIINLAGRQRMLSQKYAKEVLDEKNNKTLVSHAEKNAATIAFQIAEDRSYYTQNVIGKLKKEWPDFIADQYYHNTPKAIPLPATFVQEVSKKINESGRYRVELLSKWNINEEKGLKTDFHQRAWQALNESPDKPFREMALFLRSYKCTPLMLILSNPLCGYRFMVSPDTG